MNIIHVLPQSVHFSTSSFTKSSNNLLVLRNFYFNTKKKRFVDKEVPFQYFSNILELMKRFTMILRQTIITSLLFFRICFAAPSFISPSEASDTAALQMIADRIRANMNTSVSHYNSSII